MCKPKKLTKKQQREAIKMKYGGRCAYCGEILPERWHVDHIKAVMRISTPVYDEKGRPVRNRDGSFKFKTVGMLRPEHDDIANMNPSCIQCNLYKSCSSLENWRIRIKEEFKNYIQRNMSLKAGKRFGLLEIHDKPIEFYFEKYEREHGLPQTTEE